jgi:hypothetical protein
MHSPPRVPKVSVEWRRGSLIACYTFTETLPLRVHLPTAHRRRFRGLGFLLRCMFVSWSGPRHPRDVGRGSARCTRSRTCRRHVPTAMVQSHSLFVSFVYLRGQKSRMGVRRNSLSLGRHGPHRDANRVQCLFLLLLSLEESNQRTLRNRNARFNRHGACRRFRCVQACKAERHPALCTET